MVIMVQSDVFKKLQIFQLELLKTQRLFIFVRNDKEEQQILTFKKPEPANVWHHFLRNDWNGSLIIKIGGNLFSFHRLIDWSTNRLGSSCNLVDSLCGCCWWHFVEIISSAPLGGRVSRKT